MHTALIDLDAKALEAALEAATELTCDGGAPVRDYVSGIIRAYVHAAAAQLYGPFGWLNGCRGLSEDSWSLESDPLENSEEYFAIPLYALVDPFKEIGPLFRRDPALSDTMPRDHLPGAGKMIDADYFGELVERGRLAAAKATTKFPQPNYVTLKIAEEAGEVVRGAVHYAENRMEWAEVEGEIVQLIAMLIRFVTEGDEVNGVKPPVRRS